MLRGKHGKRLGFLSQRTHPNLPEEEVGLRKDIAREWNHIYETVHFSFSIVGHWNGLHCSSGHDMIHQSMLIMYDQQSFMAMIIDHHVWSTAFHSMINRFHAWSTAFHSMINRYHAWSIAYHSMINKFHTWSTWSMIMNDHCSLISYMINSVHKAMINYQAHFLYH